MSRNGSGTYTAPASSWSPAVNGALASYTDWNSLLADISAALTQSLSADGQTPVSGNLNMNGNKLTNLAAGTGTGQSLRWEQLFSQGTEVAIASAATVDIGAQNTNFLNVTGTTSITSFGTNYNGPRFLRFSGALTLTNSSTLILPGGANITTAAGDTCIVIPKATGGVSDGWQIVAYQKNAAPGTIADGSVTYAKLSSDVQGAMYGFKNRIINGAMMIDQRNAGASFTPANLGYGGPDRWSFLASQASKFTGQQNLNSVTPPAGFTKYLGYSVASAVSVGASDYFASQQLIEGFNFADLGWGTASAQPITVSFWVRSSLTGTFNIAVGNGSFGRGYSAVYTINSANTWEQKTITIAGDTSGTWPTDNSASLRLCFNLGAGSSASAAAGSWGTWVGVGATGAVSLVGTLGATFYITGVQLEKGSTATSFDYRPYGTELALCQRYLPAFNYSATAVLCSGSNYTNATVLAQIPFKVSTRVPPTGITISSGSILTCYSGGSSFTSSSVIFNNASTEVAGINITVSGVTQGQGSQVNFNAAGQLLFTGCEL